MKVCRVTGSVVWLGLMISPTFGQTAGTVGFQALIKDAEGNPIEVPVDLEFRIYDADVAGSLVDMDGDGAVEDICGEDVTCVSAVTAINGIVSTKVGPIHPSAFDGNPRWLEVRVDTESLSRIEMVTAPAASEQVNIPATGTPAIEVDASGNLSIPGTTQIGSSITIDGVANTVTSSADLELHVSSGRVLRLEANATSPNVIAGHPDNSVTAGALGATIGGGGEPKGLTNRVTDDYGTISGGGNNQAGDALGTTFDARYATVSGGVSNTARSENATVSGGSLNTANGPNATVGGGIANAALGFADTISGGQSNTADQNYATVGGGHFNTANQTFATVGGGQANVASGLHATIGGGDTNVASETRATVSGGGSNTASAFSSTVGGGLSNMATGLRSTVGGGFQNSATAESATVGGGRSNVVSAVYGTISGGGETTPGNSNTSNKVFDDYGTIGGGGNNQAGSDDADPMNASYATVGGGQANVASGLHATVGGGDTNVASETRATVSGGGSNTASEFSSTVGGGLSNMATGLRSTVGGGFSNLASGTVTIVGGGESNTASSTCATVGGGESNTASGSFSTVGGGLGNTVSGSYGTISGGGERKPGDPTTSNKVLDDYGTVGGGGDNQAGSNDADPTNAPYATVGGGVINFATGSHATVGGGQQNTAGAAHGTIAGGILNLVTDELGTVGGGRQNQAGDDEGTAIDASEATVGGGFGNIASGVASTVAGGRSNIASGHFASVPGGELNTAAGERSFAAGRQAKANFNGMFVWADSNAAQDFPSAKETNFTPVADQILFRARGGTVIVTAYDSKTGGSTAGVKLDPGDTAWEVLSDQNSKENFVVLDPQDVLKRLCSLPITQWNYKAQDESVRHIGPMAQDFYAAFGLSDDDRYISPIDTDGVAFAAIQGLYEIVKEKETGIEALRAEKDAQIAGLEKRLAALEDTVRKMSPSVPASAFGVATPALAVAGMLGLVAIGRSRKGGA